MAEVQRKLTTKFSEVQLTSQLILVVSQKTDNQIQRSTR